MRLVTGSEMAVIDHTAINEYAIPGIVLMENAGIKVVEIIGQVLGNPRNTKVVILAGKGNNGGDGFVIARHLYNKGARVQLFLFGDEDKVKGDALINLTIWKGMGQKIYPLKSTHDVNMVKMAINCADLIIDALYGTGFKGTVNDLLASVFKSVNSSGKTVIAVDIPSGIEADTGKINGPCIRADHTVTFAYPKLGLVIYQGCDYVGKLHVVDISIPSAVLSKIKSSRYLTTTELIKELWPGRKGPEHKGDFGRVLVIAGSRGMSGAAILAAEAAARAGAGLVTLGVPSAIHDIAENKLTEVMTFPLADTSKGNVSHTALKDILDRCHSSNVVAIGPGLGTAAETATLVKDIIMNITIPCVLDADGLNAMAGKAGLLNSIKSNLVITPHPGEMARLTGYSVKDIQQDRIGITAQKAKEWGCTILLKGARTVICGPDGSTYINQTGNPGMASGGSGDVLTGLIAGLIAQGLTPLNAAVAGAFIHGRAGDVTAKEMGISGMLAGDLLQRVPYVTKEFEQVITP
ncbi:bifunctional ADP-dependent NAD(P)H-hydrate dehydratase/NAD(P)H-hydrate epimerase [Desulfotruncus alcoholivorax]|uniref:bifunctional ADP-dependent NAD(P)H-hydrate dehydratase/NAD(P)H-hydrate epimerase n=1 Tax=Desulfotruncus alcoholivorax TaxID=265477 RepID=UPI000428E61C|nr:bifunctional ADP-dependent NAD(P)H-hydrate dehydratase/NAD(P)H-hydrate epimerase [Desulfotruncus alcoholivorax]